MRIDFVITELNVGGAEKALTEIALGMKRRGHQVRVLSIGSAPISERSGLTQRLAADDIEVEFGGFDHWTSFLGAARWLKACLLRRPPDVCQTFLFHANCLGVSAARRAGVGRVLGGLRVAESNRIRSSLERRAVAKMETLVCVSAEVQRFAEKELRVPPNRCVVIPNGVDVAVFDRATKIQWDSIGWPADSEVALFVGRLHPQKGLELIQQRAAQLLDGPRRRLLFIGDGPLREKLCEWAASFGDRVQVLGFQSNVAPFLNAAALLLLPSHYEGMPNVVLEAMAAGRPVVCSRVEGSDELLRNDPGSSVDRSSLQGFDPGDANQMVLLAEAFFTDPELSRRVGEINREAIRRDFSLETMVQSYAQLYETSNER
ncbi:MAG: glycosyltransferase [Planctomycetota bacterium]